MIRRKTRSARKPSPLYLCVRQILESARASAARSVNTTQLIANWLIGREIVEEEQRGRRRAGYGQTLVNGLALKLTEEYGKGYSAQNLWLFRQFFLTYPGLASAEILYAVRREFGTGAILHASRGELTLSPSSNLAKGESPLAGIGYAVRSKSWQPGLLHPDLSWTHYRTLLRVDKPEARALYEIEAIKNGWSARGLEPQINNLLYERLALSRDKKGLLRLATKGHEVQRPADVFKDPVVMEFLGLPESPQLVETDLEQALIDNLHTLGPDQERKIFASRYKLHLPSEAELRAEIQREVRALGARAKSGGRI